MSPDGLEAAPNSDLSDVSGVHSPLVQFVDDDAGYLAWLEGHRDGYVLNAFPHVSSSYLVLHRARCRTIHRRLAAGRMWTHQYGKLCSLDRASVESWVRAEVGKEVEPCSICLAAPTTVDRREAPPVLSPGGSRTARQQEHAVCYVGSPVRVTIRRRSEANGCCSDLVLEGAQWLAEHFFLHDPSAIGMRSYDSWIKETQADPGRRDRILDEDVTAANRTMAARTSHEAWAPLVAGDHSWLRRLRPEWSLLTLGEAEWQENAIRDALADAFAAVRRPRLGVAVATKVLHIKRPELIPVLDSLVLEQIGSRTNEDPETWVRAVEVVRAIGRENLSELTSVQRHLLEHGIDRSLVRVLDALLWTSHPRAGLFHTLKSWELVLRPAPTTTGEEG